MGKDDFLKVDRRVMGIEGLVIMGIVVMAVWLALRWFMAGRRSEDPWGPEVQAAVDSPDAIPVCHHCLAPQQHDGWFCPECGTTVGSNWLPSVYIFSIGDALRRGIAGRARVGWLLMVGFGLVTLVELSIFAPLTWLFLAKKRHALPAEVQQGNVPSE